MLSMPLKSMPIDYLLKPVQKNRLDKAIRKIRGVQLQGKGESPVDPEPGKALHVISLDYPAVYNQNDRILAWRTRKAKELFFYLWLNRQTQVNKRTLIDRLFPDKDRTRAQVLLHTTVYQIRRSLADIGFPEGILFANDSYRLQVPVTADVNELEDVLERGGSDPDRIAAILDLYKSDFLREESYDWAMETRQLLKHKTYLALASFAEKRLETRDYTDPLDACLERIHQLNPAEERTARLFLKYFGDRQRMVKLKLYYADYKRRLMQDYAMKPQPSLEELYLSLTRR